MGIHKSTIDGGDKTDIEYQAIRDLEERILSLERFEDKELLEIKLEAMKERYKHQDIKE